MRAGVSILVVTLVALNATAARRDYLPVLGPTPVRFRAAVDSSVRASLPPLAMHDVVETNTVVQPPPAVTPASAPVAAAPIATQTPATVSPASPTTPQAEAPTGPLEPAILDSTPPPNQNTSPIPAFVFPGNGPVNTVSPQMLVPYFTQQNGTNGPKTVVVAPVQFTPPVPNIPLSSTATYLTPQDGTGVKP